LEQTSGRGIVYEFTEKAYQVYRTLDLEVTETMNDTWESGEVDFSVSKDINYFLRFSINLHVFNTVTRNLLQKKKSCGGHHHSPQNRFIRSSREKPTSSSSTQCINAEDTLRELGEKLMAKRKVLSKKEVTV